MQETLQADMEACRNEYENAPKLSDEESLRTFGNRYVAERGSHHKEYVTDEYAKSLIHQFNV